MLCVCMYVYVYVRSPVLNSACVSTAWHSAPRSYSSIVDAYHIPGMWYENTYMAGMSLLLTARAPTITEQVRPAVRQVCGMRTCVCVCIFIS